MIYRHDKIGTCCRLWREDHNITIAEMAAACDCRPQNITAFERGESLSGRLILQYVKKGMSIISFEDDFYICEG